MCQGPSVWVEIHVNRQYNGVTQVPGEDLRGGNTGADVCLPGKSTGGSGMGLGSESDKSGACLNHLPLISWES